jgi:hypothetical protein
VTILILSAPPDHPFAQGAQAIRRYPSRIRHPFGFGVKPGKSTLTFTLALAAHGKRATQTLRITRR